MSSLIALLLAVLPLWAQGQDTVSESVTFPGVGVSFGWRGPVTGRLAFNRADVSGGGRILAVESPTRKDHEALRFCEALLTTEGDYLSYHAVVARELGVPVLVLEQASWARDKDGSYLILEEPVFAEETEKASGVEYQVVSRTRQRRLREGEVITVDSWAGSLTLYPPQEKESRLSTAEAMRAYDGLKDAQSLFQWYEDLAASGGGRAEAGRAAAYLISDLSDRLMTGAAKPADLCQLRKSILGSFKSRPDILRERESELWTRHRLEAMTRFAFSAEKLKSVRTREAARRLGELAAVRWERLKELANCLETRSELSRAEVTYKATARLARLRGQDLPAGRSGLAESAAAAGALLPSRVRLNPEFYRRFLEDNSLSAKIARLNEDSSRDLRGKSASIRALIRDTPLALESALGREITASLPASWEKFIFVGGSEHRPAERARWPEALKELWASMWSPSAMLARRQAKKAVHEEGAETYAQEMISADLAGAVTARLSPGSSRPQTAYRLIVSAGDGSQPLADRYVLDSVGSEILPARLAGPRRALDPEQLRAVARLMAAVEDHYGSGLEIRFGFKSGKLYVLQVGRLGPGI